MIIAIDLGTTNLKAVAFGNSGEVLATAGRNTLTFSDAPGRREQDPEAMFIRVCGVLRDLMAAKPATSEPVEALVFSAAMHSLLALDPHCQPITHAWLWSDIRSESVATRWHAEGKAGELYQRTGVPVHPMSPIVKIAWMRENEPDLWKQARWFVDLKTYVIYRLTGQLFTDWSISSSSGMFSLDRLEWDDWALSLAGINRDFLPDPVSPYTAVPLQGLPELPDIPAGTPVVLGGADGSLAVVGSGALFPESASVTIGASAALRCASNSPQLDKGCRTFCYRIDEFTFVNGGATNNGTNVLEWLNHLAGRDLGIRHLLDQARSVDPGAEGLLFLPYLFGERLPLWHSEARGRLIGLHAGHQTGHLARSVLEGIVFNLLMISDIIEQERKINRLYASDGFTATPFWVQLLADIFNREVYVDSRNTDASILGALQMARWSLGQSTTGPPKEWRIYRPEPARVETYRSAMDTFRLEMNRI